MPRQAKQNEVDVAAAPPTVGAPPQVGAPKPPDPSTWGGTAVGKYRHRVLSAASAAGKEVAAFTRWIDLGKAAPTQPKAAAALTLLGQWYSEEQAADLWHQYTRSQLAAAAANANHVVGPLQGPFEALLATEPQVVESFQALHVYFNAAKESAQKGVSTRDRNARRSAKENTASPAPAADAANAGVKAPKSTG